MNKEELNCYYQSNIKTSRNEDSVYAIKYASQQMLIDKLEHNWNELKKWLEECKKISSEQDNSIGYNFTGIVLNKMQELERGEE